MQMFQGVTEKLKIILSSHSLKKKGGGGTRAQINFFLVCVHFDLHLEMLAGTHVLDISIKTNVMGVGGAMTIAALVI